MNTIVTTIITVSRYICQQVLKKGSENNATLTTLKSKILITFAVVVLYSVSDEIHQMFVPGRAAMFGDVVIDAVGGAAGILAMVGAKAVAGKHRSRLLMGRTIR